MFLVGVTAVATEIEEWVIAIYVGSIRSFFPLEDLLNGEDLAVPLATELHGVFNDAARVPSMLQSKSRSMLDVHRPIEPK